MSKPSVDIKKHMTMSLPINIIINLILNFPSTYFSFKNISNEAPGRLFALPSDPLGTNLFGDLMITTFFITFIMTWIVVALTCAMVSKNKITIDEPLRLEKGKAWKTKGWLMGIIFSPIFTLVFNFPPYIKCSTYPYLLCLCSELRRLPYRKGWCPVALGTAARRYSNI